MCRQIVPDPFCRPRLPDCSYLRRIVARETAGISSADDFKDRRHDLLRPVHLVLEPYSEAETVMMGCWTSPSTNSHTSDSCQLQVMCHSVSSERLPPPAQRRARYGQAVHDVPSRRTCFPLSCPCADTPCPALPQFDAVHGLVKHATPGQTFHFSRDKGRTRNVVLMEEEGGQSTSADLDKLPLFERCAEPVKKCKARRMLMVFTSLERLTRNFNNLVHMVKTYTYPENEQTPIHFLCVTPAAELLQGELTKENLADIALRDAPPIAMEAAEQRRVELIKCYQGVAAARQMSARARALNFPITFFVGANALADSR